MHTKSIVSSLCFALCSLAAYLPTASASTISVVDAPGITVISANTSYCPNVERGNVIALNCYGGEGMFLTPQEDRYAFLRADIGALAGLEFDRVYLSLTEIRTGAFFRGTANVFSADGNVDSAPGSDIDSYLRDIDRALSASMNPLGSITGTGVGGNQLLFDVTDAVRLALSRDRTGFGLLLTPSDSEQNYLGILGSNYHSGLPACTGDEDPDAPQSCQYYAKSYYELPTLIATRGTDITPIDQLPPRPLPPLPPIDVPEPGTAFLMLAGAFAIARTAAVRRKRG